jgi:hypothetical protein
MDEISDDTKAGFQRVELLTGAIRRRRWSAWRVEISQMASRIIQARLFGHILKSFHCDFSFPSKRLNKLPSSL